MLGSVLLLLVVGAGVVDHNRIGSAIESERQRELTCVSSGHDMDTCGNAYVIRTNLDRQKWRNHRAWFGFGALAVIVLDGVALYAVRDRRLAKAADAMTA